METLDWSPSLERIRRHGGNRGDVGLGGIRMIRHDAQIPSPPAITQTSPGDVTLSNAPPAHIEMPSADCCAAW